MATTIDTLVTKYVLDDQYSAKVAGIGRAADKAYDSLRSVATYAATAGVAAFGLGVKASTVAAQFEVLNQGLEVVTGSAKRAKEVFDFVQAQAGPSAFFGVKELGEASKLLEAFKIKTEEFLPIANTMASIFGQNTESLNGFVMALGRLKAGSFGEGFERLREMGITRSMLEKEGLKFGSGGQFSGTSDQALRGVQSAVQKNFGGIDKAMGETFQAKLATAGDMVEQAFGKVGKELNTAIMPYLQTFSSDLQTMINDGQLQAFGQMLGDSVPGIIDNFTAIKTGLMNFAEAVDAIASLFDWKGYNQRQRDKENVETLNANVAYMQGIKGKDGLTVAERIARNKANDKGGETFTGEPTPENKPASPIVRQNTVFLGEIAKNTRQSVELQRMAFGSGASSMGVSTVELSDISRSRTGGKIGKAVRLLTDTIQEEMLRTYQQGEASRRQSFGRA